MALDEQYLTYEEILQDLQINRSQLNQLVREGHLREHVVEGETKFRSAEVQALKRELEKRPTVVEEGVAAEPSTDTLEGAEEAAPSGEPETEVLEVEGAATDERGTDLLEAVPAAEELELETPTKEEELELEKPLAQEPAASDTALETELDLKAVEAEPAEEKAEEIFDFAAGEEFELEEGPEPAVEEAVAEEEEEELVPEVLAAEVGQEVAEEDLLSEIMEIEEEHEEEFIPTEDTEEVTAEIATLEEPTYEESELGEVLEVEELEFGEGLEEGEELELPYAAPVTVAEAQAAPLWVALLALSLVIMIVAMLFVVENALHPDFSTPLTSWVLPG